MKSMNIYNTNIAYILPFSILPSICILHDLSHARNYYIKNFIQSLSESVYVAPWLQTPTLESENSTEGQKIDKARIYNYKHNSVYMTSYSSI